MKKKLVGIFLIMVIAIVTTFNVNRNLNQENDMSVLTLANVEALANSENSGGGTIKCYTTVTSSGGQMTHYSYCGTCSAVLAYSASGTSFCKP